MVKQLSVFVENKPGSFQKVTSLLRREGIQLCAFCSVDSPEFGILRIIADRPEDAEKVLETEGFMVKNYDVIAVRMDHQDTIDDLMGACSESNISINYMYSGFNVFEGGSAVVLHTEYPDETESMLRGRGFGCID